MTADGYAPSWPDSPEARAALQDRVRLSDHRRRLLAEQEHRAMLALQRRFQQDPKSLGPRPPSKPNAPPPPEPRVSIIMPVFNGQPYFEAALQSALAQTYSDLEIIIIDDGSTDDGWTEATGRFYAAEHPDKVRYIRQENTGVSGALNTGVRHMTGDIFCWLSHDDLFTPDKTAVQAAAWRRIGRPDAMLISDYGIVDAEGRVMVSGAREHGLYAAAPRLPLYRGGVHGCTVFIPASLLKERAEPFDPGLRYAGDYNLWLKLAAERDFIHLPRTLVYSRRHSGQDSHKPQAAEEGDDLWRRMVDGLGEVQRAQLYGSSWRFYNETHRILSGSPYEKTTAYLAYKRDHCLSETLISVVVQLDGRGGALRTVQSVLDQTHPNLDVLVMETGEARERPKLKALVDADPRVRLLGLNAAPEAVDAAIRMTMGAYIALITEAAEWPPHKLAAQLRTMAWNGALLSYTTHETLSSGEAHLSKTDAVMFHRSLLAGGLLPLDHDWEQPETWERLAQASRAGVLP